MIHTCLTASRLAISALIATAIAGPALGEVTIGNPDPGPNPVAGQRYFGESFIAPAGEAGLKAVSLPLFRSLDGTGQANATFRVYRYDATTGFYGQFVGAPLYSEAIPIAFSDNQLYSFSPNLPLTGGDSYALVIDFDSASSGNTGGRFYATDYYADGTMFAYSSDTGLPYKYPTYDLSFSATFGAIPEPGAVMALVGPGALLLRRRG